VARRQDGKKLPLRAVFFPSKEARMTFRRRHHIELVNRIKHWLTDAFATSGPRVALA
jgi:hypothetical protein